MLYVIVRMALIDIRLVRNFDVGVLLGICELWIVWLLVYLLEYWCAYVLVRCVVGVLYYVEMGFLCPT